MLPTTMTRPARLSQLRSSEGRCRGGGFSAEFIIENTGRVPGGGRLPGPGFAG